MLYLWMPEGQGTWLWRTDQLQLWQCASSIEHLIQAVQQDYTAKEAIVFFPSQTAQFEVKPLLRAQYKQLGVQGIQYLLEENNIEPIDQLAIFHHYAKNELHLMAISKQTRETYQHVLSLLPWQIQALLPDFLIVTAPEVNQLNLLQVHDRVLWRSGEYQGWLSEDLSLVSLVVGAEKTVNVAGLSDRNQPILSAQITDTLQVQSAELAQLSADLTKIKNHPFNALLKIKKASQQSGYWKACAGLLLLALATQVLYDGLRWWKYKQIADQTAELALSQYKQWFPNETRVNEQNLTTQFTAKIRANASADVQALDLISRVGPILQQANISAKQVVYQDNSLSLQLSARNAELLNALVAQFKQQGFSAELGAIKNEGADVVGMVKVQ